MVFIDTVPSLVKLNGRRNLLGFYFIIHTILGFFIGSCALLQHATVIDKPLWLSSGIGQFFNSLASLLAVVAFFGAILATMSKYGFGWGLATFGELVLGLFLARLAPVGLKVIGLVISPVAIIIILGALFGFWRI